jgi:hypothetical protein
MRALGMLSRFAAFAVAMVLIAGVAWPLAHAEARAVRTPVRAAEWTAIRNVIGDQLKAFKAEDGRKAISYASPALREQFGTPERFLAMVHGAYEPLIAARYTEFLEGAVVDGVVVQPLRLIAPDNSVLVALYTMEKQKDGRWKIAGCLLAPSTVRAA